MSDYRAGRIRWPRVRIIGDTYEPFWVQLVDETGALVDLSTATATIKITNDADGSTIVAASCTITGSTVLYYPADADVAAAGNITWLFTVTFANAKISRVMYCGEICASN